MNNTHFEHAVNNTPATDIKLIEARTAILLRNTHSYSTRNEPTMWILEHMFRPFITYENDEFQLLHLSGSIKPPWESNTNTRKRKELPGNNQPASQPSTNIMSSTEAGTPTPPVISSQHLPFDTPKSDKMYIMTPRTKILTVAKEHCMVFMIDLSSSLATIETTTGKIMIGDTFSVLENMIHGLVRPFSFNVSDTTPPIVMEHSIRMTVIAECSQFGSNMNVIPILAEYPTMRVLLQNILVSINNVTAVLKQLDDLINTFKKDLGKFRKKLTTKRSKMGYELDVREEHAQTVSESPNFSTATNNASGTSPTNQRKNSMIKHTRIKSLTNKNNKKPTTEVKKPHHHHHSSSTNSAMTAVRRSSNNTNKKDVWGVGKTGSTLSYILRAGLFALDLLPSTGQPSLILITDGVVKSNIQDESVIRQLTSANIQCSVVQIGQGGFIPGLNFGFVPDNEILTFLTQATQGQFMLAEQCPTISKAEITFTEPPNVYHHRLLLREINLDKVKKTEPNNEEKNHRVFPWDPLSRPITEDIGICKYKEYFLPIECWHFMKARLRQGFILHSVALMDETSKKKAEEESSFQKKESVIIVLILHWQPNITVEYRIKSLWTSSLRHYLKSLNQERLMQIPEEPHLLDDDNMFSCMRATRAQIIIKSTASFTHMLSNWDQFQRRNQIMAVQGATKSNIDLAPGFIKVGKMKKLLERLAETDNMLRQLVQFHHHDKALTAVDNDWSTQLNYVQKFSSHWAKLERSELRVFNMCWFDEHCFNLIIGSSLTPLTIKEYRLDGAHTMGAEFNQVQVAFNQIYFKLESWSTFMSEDQVVYIRLMMDKKAPQFCEARVVRETDNLVCIKLFFFNIDINQRHLMIAELQSLLNNTQQQTLTSLEVKALDQQQADPSTITLTERPLSSLLMRDGVHFLPTATEFENGKLFTATSTQPKTLWFIDPALLLTGEFIVRNYLLQYTWHWDTRDVPSDKHVYGRYFTPLQSLAFEHITVTRLEQGWKIISFSKSFAHFYKEMTIDNNIGSIQFFIWKDFSAERVSTELWLEPSFANDHIRHDIFEKDKQTLSQLVTFDIIYGFGLHLAAFDSLLDQMEVADEARGVVKWMHRTLLFHLSSVLKLGSLLFALYSCPNYNRHYHPEHDCQQAVPAVAVTSSNDNLDSTSSASTAGGGYVRSRRAPATPMRSRQVSKFSPAGSPSVKNTPLMCPHHNNNNNTCTCPRPDALICSEKDDISKLPPVLRDLALLHYYVENSLSAVTDRSMSLNKTPPDEFWSTIMQQLSTTQSILHVAQNFRDLRCFIKIFDTSVFVLVLIPRLDAVVKGLHELDEFEALDRMGLMMFECQRQDSHTSINQIKITSLDPLDSLRPTLRPDLFKGFQEPLSDRMVRLTQDISQVYSRSFVKSIFTCLMHGRAIDSEDFEKVLEICDESNLDIDLTGYLNVQTLLKRKSRTSEEELASANQRFISVLGHYFEPVIISNSKWNNMYCYRPPFAKVGQKLGLSLSSGEKPTNLADVVVCAQNPLFVRLDCTLRKPIKEGGFTEITFPLRNLPASYQGETEEDVAYNYEPESIGSKFSPVDSADGTTATLHLVCMTLPQSEYDPPNALFSHKPACPADSAIPPQASFLDADKTHRARLPSLSQDKQDALVETEARLTWLFTEEIMHGLLRSGPITQNVIRYIEAQLKKKNPFVDFPTTMFIPLAFVKSQKDSRRMFFEQLEKHSNSPYRLVRVGDCFYASDNGTKLRQQQEELEFDGEGLNITTDKSKEGSDEFCEGLGISILEPETPEEEDEDSNQVKPQLYWLLLIPQAQNVQIYFYSKMQQSVNRSEIIRVTKMMVNEVMERTNKISLLQYLHDTRRCSKYLLAPACDDERILDSSGDESSEEEEEEDDNVSGSGNNLVEILSTSGEEATLAPPKKFTPGQFSCEAVFTKRFPLHWRLQPNAAFNKLMTDTLPPFLVKNKPGMFVISHENSVVYFFLSEVSTTMHSSTLSDSMTQSFLSTNNEAEEGYYMSHPESPYGSSFMNIYSNDDALGASTHSRARHASHIYSKNSPQGSVTSERQQFSPRNSPSFTEAGYSSPAKRLNGRQYEGRELVLEVHGVETDNYIVEGLVEMIDARITSEITLKEVQQFLVRNPNSKLSRADIEFILPIEREPLIHKQLCIPALVENTVQFLRIFRKNILAGSSLHAIQSNYLSSVIKRHHDLRYSSYGNSDFNNRLLAENSSHKVASEEWSALDLSFYYNHLNRAPGMYLAFEQKIGEGVAGMCLSVVNQDDLAYSKIYSGFYTAAKFNVEDLTAYINSDFEVDNEEAKLKICIDVWSHCKLDVTQIYNYIHMSFRQSICDYIIENTVSAIPRQLINPDRTQQVEFKSVAALLKFALEKAAEWESATVKQVTKSIQLPPWYFDGIVQQLQCDLMDIHPSLEPTIARAQLSSDLSDFLSNDVSLVTNYKLYNPGSDEVEEYGTRKPSTTAEVPLYGHENYRYLIVSGLPELSNKFVLPSRRTSSEVTDSGSRRIIFGNGANSILEEEPSSYLKTVDGFKRDDTGSLHSRQESLASSISKIFPNYLSKQKSTNMVDSKDISHQHSFLVFTLDSLQLSVFAYNCSDNFTEHVFNTTYKSVVQQETRHMGLSNILHQKLGLFHHTDKMSKIIYRNIDPAVTVPAIPVPATPLQHSAVTQVQNASNTRNTMLPIANTIGRLVQTDSSVSIPSIDSSSSDRRTTKNKCNVDLDVLRQLVTNTFEYNNHRLKGTTSNINLQRFMSIDSGTNVFETQDNVKLCRRSEVYTAVRGADANTVLRDVYAESTAENKNKYDKDYLLRHGEPYLEMYLARSKPLAAHKKAFKVYTKWADHYYAPGHTRTTDEMMTVDELKQILKASRLLHFCRTPLIFSQASENKVIKSEEMTVWYERLSRGFMREYASYLESIGMHLIVYGPSNDQQDEVDAYLSQFTISENYSVDSPVVYLLQVFEGGSIMCEVRLTGAFVSVTLYTLHRRYGRLQHAPYIHQQRTEIGRANFQNFMGECDQFKQRIHVNSFVFDFHLRYIQRSLDDVELLPSNLNLLSILKNTVSVYDRPAIYSRNRVMNGIYEFSVDDSLVNLSAWILLTAKKLKLQTLTVDSVPVACFVSSDHPSFEGGEKSPYRYTLVICPAEKMIHGKWRESMNAHKQGSFDMIGSNPTQKLVSNIVVPGNGDEYSRKASLQYFIMVTYCGMDRCSSYDRCQKAWSEVLKEKPQRYVNFLDEVLVPETYKMNDVFEYARLKIDSIVNEAIQLFHREAAWNKLYEIVRPNLTKESPENLVQLIPKFNPIDLAVADPTFNKFFKLKGLNWNDALDNLKLFYHMTSGEIQIRDTRHVLLFIPNATLPTFFHFFCSPEGTCIATINVKEDRIELSEDERSCINHLATNLSYYIWKRVH